MNKEFENRVLELKKELVEDQQRILDFFLDILSNDEEPRLRTIHENLWITHHDANKKYGLRILEIHRLANKGIIRRKVENGTKYYDEADVSYVARFIDILSLVRSGYYSNYDFEEFLCEIGPEYGLTAGYLREEYGVDLDDWEDDEDDKYSMPWV